MAHVLPTVDAADRDAMQTEFGNQLTQLRTLIEPVRRERGERSGPLEP